MVTRSSSSAAAGWATRTKQVVGREDRALDWFEGEVGHAATDELGLDRLPLAQQVARTEDGEHDSAALGRVEGDLDPALRRTQTTSFRAPCMKSVAPRG